jgi:hypothetical protein
MMRTNDLVTRDRVSDGFLALTAAGFMRLCSSLLAIAFS